MNKLIYIFLFVISLQTFSQDKSTPIIRVFTNYHTNLTSESAFQITRGYLGYNYIVSEKYSMKVIYDVADPVDGGNLKHTGYIKIAQLQYKFNKLQWRIGMIPTKQFKYQEHYWGYRYLLKSFQDQYHMNASADIGVSAEYKFTDKIKIETIIQNGEGYKNIQSDNTFRGGIGLIFEPLDNLRFRIYYDNSTNSNIQLQTFATYIGYDIKKKLSLGAEYNQQLDYKYKGQSFRGSSIYATYFINKKYQLFSRYDYFLLEYNSIKTIGDYFIIGVQSIIEKGIKISLNYRLNNSMNMIFINLEYKLK